jgi:hypothetical protein
MYKIVTGTQYEQEVSNIFEAKIKIETLFNALDTKMIYVYNNDVLVMVSENKNGTTEYHEMYADDNVYYGMCYEGVL